MGRKKTSAREDEGAAAAGVAQGGGKSKKKNLLIDDDEYSIGTELSEESILQEEKTAPGGGGGKKKGKKGNLKKLQSKDDDDDGDQLEEKIVNDEDDEGAAIQFTGKKKGKVNKFSSSNFGLLEDNGMEEEDLGLTQDRDVESGVSEDDDKDVVAFIGKKKPTKSKKDSGKSLISSSAFDVIGDENDEVGGELVSGKLSNNDDEPIIEFSGKKKPSKSCKKGGGQGFTTSELG